MNSFDPYDFNDPVSYAAQTGDSSLGVTYEQALPGSTSGDVNSAGLSDPDTFASETDPNLGISVGSVITIIVAAILLAVGISSIL